MRNNSFKAALCLAFIATAGQAAAAAAIDPARQVAPADGWASQAGGTVGGSAAIESQIYTVTTRAQLLAAITNGGTASKIIKLSGVLDMSEGKPYTSSADQSARGAVRLKSNTTLIGDRNSGLVNGHIVLSNVSQIIIRNLKFVNPCDVGPVWDPLDGATGNWNSAFDAISVSGSDHVWIDRNSFTDLPVTDNFLPVENGHVKQCHDGALDITNASDYVTVSYNEFGEHNKNNLVGGGDGATADEGKLRVTFSNNVFRDVASRAPRVRYGQVHLFNNYYSGSRTHPVYRTSYYVGVGHAAKILSSNNVFEVAGATACSNVVQSFGGTIPGAFKDSGSLLNAKPLGDCGVSGAVTWTPPYAFSARPIALVKANALAQAGGGKLTTTISGTGKVIVDTGPSLSCPASGLYVCDDFQGGNAAKWDLLPVPGPNGAFSVVDEVAGGANKVLQYTAASTGGVLALLKTSTMDAVPSGDYFVEARIRPMTNGTTGNKHLFLVTRYQDASNWYGAGLNVQNSTASTQVEIAKMLAGTLSRPRQVRKPIAMDAQFYTVRFEMIGSTLTVYLDGENLGSVTDTSFAARGRVGLYTANKSFQIDDVRIGDPRLKPVQLTLDPGTPTWAAEAGDAPLQVKVTSVAADGTADSFSAESNNPAVATVTKEGNTVSIAPVGAGTANVVFRSGSDSTVVRSISVTIAPQFVQPTQTYALQGVAMPAAGSSAGQVDATLRLVFDNAPTLGSGGTIRVFRKRDDALVDVIRLSGETDMLGYPGQDQVRKVNVAPIRIVGNTVTIKPHSNKLDYGTEYYVAIADGVFTGASLNGTPFAGIGKAAGWTFTTRADQPTGSELSVDDDGPAHFSTVQGALSYAMKSFGKAEPVTIRVKNGSYEELLFLRGKDNVSIVGESRDGVVIRYTNHETFNGGTGASQPASATASPAGGRSVMLVETSDMLSLESLTLKNTTLRSPAISGQAETIYFNSDGRLVVKNASFFSEQDTLNLKGWAWFYRSLVAGNVDFIWGSSRAALFEESEIRSVGDTNSPTSGGYVLQARVPAATDKGYVFLNSSLTHGPGPGPLAGDVPAGATWLARSPGGTTSWDNIAFINCRMDNHVAPAGWAGQGVNGQPAPNPVTPNATSGWREYGSTDLAGNPLDLSRRVGGYLLRASDVDADFATRAKVFSAYGNGIGWNPQP
ncbi:MULTISPECIES: pectinesterase family protein [unclassified Massilia]|uniref:pectinesterase family protein n=1 Tax=unclassified Massilia TaxID=2609279 RepID=UPI001781A500|nr:MULTISPECIES: pectinesterase family protein [unclassified Massilia]MBD8528459.1 Ig-like domain-containing protein [Massilia sp. CFBP 13647]MBD8671918.1 Ig-like domain-containing protein [Massilia sp. CFBP 13721]